MNEENRLIELIIAIPLAMKVLSNDKYEFEELYAGNAYLDLLDKALHTMQKDYGLIKRKLYQSHNITVQKSPSYKNSYEIITKYESQLIKFSPKQLKEMTKNTMKEYLFEDRSQPFKQTERVWKNYGMQPPNPNID